MPIAANPHPPIDHSANAHTYRPLLLSHRHQPQLWHCIPPWTHRDWSTIPKPRLTRICNHPCTKISRGPPSRTIPHPPWLDWTLSPPCGGHSSLSNFESSRDNYGVVNNPAWIFAVFSAMMRLIIALRKNISYGIYFAYPEKLKKLFRCLVSSWFTYGKSLDQFQSKSTCPHAASYTQTPGYQTRYTLRTTTVSKA